MKFLSVIFVVIALAILSSGCRSTTKRHLTGPLFECSIKFKPGWKNRHTLYFFSVGSPTVESIGVIRRKRQAHKRARKCARSIIFEKFKQTNPKFVAGPAFAYLRSQFIALLDKIHEKKVEFDDDQNCKISLELNYKNLKALIQKGDNHFE